MEEQKGPFPLGFNYAPTWQKGGEIPWPTRQRVIDAMEETAKEGGALLFGHGVGKLTELAARSAGRVRMLGETASRIGRGLGRMLNEWPRSLPVPQTADDLERIVANGVLKDATGKALDVVKKDIIRQVPVYQPGQMAAMTLGGRGPIPSRGVIFRMLRPVKLPNGAVDMVEENMDAESAMSFIQRLSGGSYTPGGSETGGEMAGAERQALHKNRELFIQTLKDNGYTDLANAFDRASADYGAAATVTDIFINSKRADGFINQPAVRTRLAKEMEHLNRLFKDGRAVEFQSAVSPVGRAAVPETEWGGHTSAGVGRVHSFFSPPRPYMPEDPRMVAPMARFLASPQFRPALAYPGLRSSTFWGPWLAQKWAGGDEGGQEGGGMD